MRTDENFFKQVILKEIACPSEKDCPRASRCADDDEGAYKESGVGWMRAVHADYAGLLDCVTNTVIAFYKKLFQYKLKLLDTHTYIHDFRECIVAPDAARLKLLRSGVEHCKLHLCTSYGELVRSAEQKIARMVMFVGPRIPANV